MTLGRKEVERSLHDIFCKPKKFCKHEEVVTDFVKYKVGFYWKSLQNDTSTKNSNTEKVFFASATIA